MAIYDLDRDESIDIVVVNGREYKIGDVPLVVKEKMIGVKVNL
jgi:hypothetical protein